MEKLKELEEKIGYQFQDINLLKNALTHSSYANEHRMPKFANNERLEFLGDAVLELVTSEFLFHNKKKMVEGAMTKMRASMVCEPTLAFCTREFNLGSYLLLGKGEELTGGRERDSIVSDAMEALIGAIYLDGGFANAKEFINRFILSDLEHKQLFFDSKTILQEMVQSSADGTLSYELIREEGPDHDKRFVVQVMIGKEPAGVGSGRTKKAAEQEAAYAAIKKLKKLV
ncbi:MAG: ribonuclease III [Lachnospiraceae bacterium]|nr:ribonuclease III [Lachnospiraceae bacterium]